MQQMFLFFLCVSSFLTGAEEREGEEISSLIYRAEEFYRTGEEAITSASREEAWNQALSTYLQVEREHTVSSPSFHARLYYNMANCYFNLHAYEWAVVFYHKALALQPRWKESRENMRMAKERAALPSVSFFHSFSRYLLFPFTSREIVIIYGCLLSLLLLFSSVLIWVPSIKFRYLRNATFCILIAFLIYTLYFLYFFPEQGVIIKPTFIYKEPSMQYMVCDGQALVPGTELFLHSSDSPGWWKVSSSGCRGFVPEEMIYPIDGFPLR